MSCLRPITLKKNQKTVPCGHCPGCLYTYASSWAFRLLQEEKVSDSSHFITFTYNDDNILRSPSGLKTLYKRDLQLFFKRLRRLHDTTPYSHLPIKYYAVGEYGNKTKRPHYHAIIFNANVDLIELAWARRDKYNGVRNIIGEIYYGDVSGASVGYTLKYIHKGKTVPQNPFDDRVREFSLISKGVGKSYLTENMINWHLADLHNRNYVNLDGGVKIAMPRYYYSKIYDGYHRDLLLMSGSLARQHKFYTEFTHTYYQRDLLKNQQLHYQRVNGEFRRHKILNETNYLL